MKRKAVFTAVLLVVGITLIGCEDGLVDPGTKARLVVLISGESDVNKKVSDESNGIQAVYLTITGVDIKPSDEMWRSLNVLTGTVNLVELTGNGLTEKLIDEELNAGWYEQIRLYFDDSKIVVNDVEHDLLVPSGLQTGYKLVDEFEIESDVTYELHIDFDIDQSIVKTGEGTYILKPTTRVTMVTQ